MSRRAASDESAAGGHRIGRFAWERALRSATLPSNTKYVLLLLATHMDGDGGSATVSANTLAGYMGVHRQAVAAHLERARQLGWLQVRERTGSTSVRAALLPVDLSAQADTPRQEELSAGTDTRRPPTRTSRVRVRRHDQSLTRSETTTTYVQPPAVQVIDAHEKEDAMPASQGPQPLVDAETVDALLEHAIAQLRPQHQRRVVRRDEALRKAGHELARLGFRPGDLVEELSVTNASIGNPTSYLTGALERLVATGAAPPAPAVEEASPSLPACGNCDQHRQVELPDGRMRRCQDCHPLVVHPLVVHPLVDQKAAS